MPQLFDALHDLTAYRMVDARIEDALALARPLLTIAENAAEPALVIEAECDVGAALVHLGRHRAALAHLARAAELHDAARDAAHATRFGRHPAAVALGYRGLALACRDDVEGARYAVATAAELLRAQPHPAGEAWLACIAATVALLCGEHEVVLRESQAALAIARSEGLDDRLAQATVLRGCARVEGGEREAGLAELQGGLEMWTATGAVVLRPFLHGLLAAALARSAEPELGLAALEEARRWVAGGERWYEPELHRLRAELLVCIGDCAGARRSVGAAVSLARRMSARRWERGAAATLASVDRGAPVG